MKTLPDLLDDHLSLLSIGLNPSLPSVQAGFYFANPRNRFWKALNNCHFLSQPIEPSLKSCHHLFKRYRIGFTDLVKRPTAGCKDLNANDYRTGSLHLQTVICSTRPALIWFHGKLCCQKFVQYSDYKGSPVSWGLQSWKIDNLPVYVTPNPSPANAAFSLADITDSYQQLFQVLKTTRC